MLDVRPVWGKSKRAISPAHEVIKKAEAKHSLLYKSHTLLAGTKTQKEVESGTYYETRLESGKLVISLYIANEHYSRAYDFPLWSPKPRLLI